MYPFLQQSLNIPQDLPSTFMFFLEGFVISDFVFACEDPTYNPSPMQELSLLTQISDITKK